MTYRPKKKWMTWTCALSFAMGVVFLIALYLPVVYQEEGVVYYLKPGRSNRAFTDDLDKLGLLPFSSLFSLYVYTQRHAQLKKGEYVFPYGASPMAIWRQVTEGKGYLYRSFTIIPGWSFQQLRNALAHAIGLRPLSAKWSNEKIMESIGYTGIHPEGEFFPETYRYTRGVPDLVILKRAADLMQSKLQIAWQNRLPNLPYKNTYEALIAASLIEKEAYFDHERALIAGVLVNRLRQDMLLQFDPTVIYGLGQRYDGRLYKLNLQEDTAYNTYLHKGLPPTPIAMPSLASIEAAVRPQQTSYLYFVAKGDHSHQFSVSLPEHQQAVATAINHPNPKQHKPNGHYSNFFNESVIQNYLNGYFRHQTGL